MVIMEKKNHIFASIPSIYQLGSKDSLQQSEGQRVIRSAMKLFLNLASVLCLLLILICVAPWAKTQ